MLGVVAKFEADFSRSRTRNRTAIVEAACKLHGRKPKPAPSQEKFLMQLHRTGAHTTAGITELFGTVCPTVYRAVKRAVD